MTIKEKFEMLKKWLQDIAERIKNLSAEQRDKLGVKLAAFGLSLTMLFTMVACGNQKNDMGQIEALESKLAEIEMTLQKMEGQIQNAEISDEQNKEDVLAISERCNELKSIVEKYKDVESSLLQHSEQLDKMQKLIEGIQSGALKGEDLVNAIDVLKTEMENQSKEILNIVEGLHKDDDFPMKHASVMDGVAELTDKAEIEEKLVVNVKKLTSDVNSGVRTDYEVVFADLERAEAAVDRTNKFQLSDEAVKRVHGEIIEAQLAVARKDFGQSMDGVENANYSKMNYTETTPEYSGSTEFGFGKNDRIVYNAVSIEMQDNQDTEFAIFNNDKYSYADVKTNSYGEYNDRDIYTDFANQIESLMNNHLDFGLMVENYKNGSIDSLDLAYSSEGMGSYSIVINDEKSTGKMNLNLGQGMNATSESNGVENSKEEVKITFESMTKEEFNERAAQIAQAINKIKESAQKGMDESAAVKE